MFLVNLAILHMLLCMLIVPQVSLALMRHFQTEILRETTSFQLLILFHESFPQQPPAVLTKVIQNAIQIPNMEAVIIAFETEKRIMREFQETINPKWASLSDSEGKYKTPMKKNQELIQHIRFLHGAFAKLEKAITELKHQLHHLSNKLNRLALFFIHIFALSYVIAHT